MHWRRECRLSWEELGEKILWIDILWDYACQIEESGLEPKGSGELLENFEPERNQIIIVLYKSYSVKWETLADSARQILKAPKDQDLDLTNNIWGLLMTYFLKLLRHMSLRSPFQWDFPGGSEGKASACSVGDPGLIPGLGRSPGEGNGNPLQDSCLENSMDRGAW